LEVVVIVINVAYKMSLRRESDFAHLEQLLREADKRAKQEQKHADEEQRNRQEAEFRTQIKEMYLSAVRKRHPIQNPCVFYDLFQVTVTK
jgi:beta-lactamase regulating signal transducer with metallopeptidase domain